MNRKMIFSLLSFLILMLSSTAYASVILFDDARASLGEGANPATFYQASLGVTFTGSYYGVVGGVANGDPGNWDFNGTNGATFLGTNSNLSGPIISFSSIVTSGTLDLGVSMSGTVSFQILGYLNNTLVSTKTLSITDNNNGTGTWNTVSFANVDKVVVQRQSGTIHFFGLDNINFNITSVPEPASIILFCVGIFFIFAKKI